MKFLESVHFFQDVNLFWGYFPGFSTGLRGATVEGTEELGGISVLLLLSTALYCYSFQFSVLRDPLLLSIQEEEE